MPQQDVWSSLIRSLPVWRHVTQRQWEVIYCSYTMRNAAQASRVNLVDLILLVLPSTTVPGFWVRVSTKETGSHTQLPISTFIFPLSVKKWWKYQNNILVKMDQPFIIRGLAVPASSAVELGTVFDELPSYPSVQKISCTPHSGKAFLLQRRES